MARPKKKKPVEALENIPRTANGQVIPDEVMEIAQKVGFRMDQIVSFTDLPALKDAIYQIDPVSRIRLDESPPPKSSYAEPPKPLEVEKSVAFMVSIDSRWIISANHAACEEMQIQSELRARRIKNIQSLSIVRPYIPDKRGQLVSQVTVNYKEQA